MRYNISQNDRGQIFDLICGRLTNTKIYNNVFYVGEAAQIINNGNGSTGANAEFYNNIFYVTTTSPATPPAHCCSTPTCSTASTRPASPPTRTRSRPTRCCRAGHRHLDR